MFWKLNFTLGLSSDQFGQFLPRKVAIIMCVHITALLSLHFIPFKPLNCSLQAKNCGGLGKNWGASAPAPLKAPKWGYGGEVPRRWTVCCLCSVHSNFVDIHLDYMVCDWQANCFRNIDDKVGRKPGCLRPQAACRPCILHPWSTEIQMWYIIGSWVMFSQNTNMKRIIHLEWSSTHISQSITEINCWPSDVPFVIFTVASCYIWEQ